MAEADPVAAAPVAAEPAPPMVEEVAAAEPVAVPVTEVAPAPVVVAEVAPSPIIAVEQAREIVAAAVAPVAYHPVAKAKRFVAAKPGLSPRAASLNDSRLPVRRAAFAIASGNSKSVVQLGAYSSRASVTSAWARVAAKYPSLRGYKPGTARFDGPRGIVYRLSVSGFSSQGHAQNVCSALKNRGGACFVRTVAGERPVQLASL